MKINIEEKQKLLNAELAIKLANLNVKKIVETFVGNSIGGYSMINTIKPTILRNTSINEMMEPQGIEVELHNFSRSQNNSDEHLFEWLISNKKESEINKMNRNDYSGGPTSMPCDHFDQSKMDEYFPLNLEKDMGLRDIQEIKDPNTANLFVYCGCTGAWLDGVTRHGSLAQKFTPGVNWDLRGLEAFLKYTHCSNRKNETNTQIYVCGAPNLLGIHISGIINRRIKSVVKKYPHAVYVDPVIAKVFYNNSITGKKGIDIHYNEEEYLKFINNILQSFIDNYAIKKAMINVDRDVYNLSSDFELSGTEIFKEKNFVIDSLDKILTKQQFTSEKEELKFYKQALKFLTFRSPYDFCYVGKDNIKNVLIKKIKG